MNDLTVFQNEMFGDLRAVSIDGDPWFAAKDVCDCLGLGNSRQAISRLDDDEKGVISNDTLGGKQEMTFVSEAGLYTLIGTSRKKEAKDFRRWVTHEVLPSIRKHGIYATDAVLDKIIADPDFGIKLLTELKEEKAARIEAEQKNAVLQPKADFYDAVADSTTALDLGKVAKLLAFDGIGRNKLFSILRQERWLMDDNVPYQEYVNRGYFKVIEYKYVTSYGEVKIDHKTLVYQRGVDAIRKLLSARIAQVSMETA